MTTPSKPARSPWPIALTALFIVFALYLAGFIVWAVGQKQDLVTEDYYDREVRYQEQLDRLNRTATLAAESKASFDAVTKKILLTLPAHHAATATGRIQFYRPANARLDHVLPLALSPGGAQVLDGSKLAPGLWKVRVQWQVGGEDFYFDQSVIVN